MRQLLAAALWATASAAPGTFHHSLTAEFGVDKPSHRMLQWHAEFTVRQRQQIQGDPNAYKTLWMFWDKGEEDLKRQAPGTWYGHGLRCMEYWKRLNPDYKMHLLDDEDAQILSPTYRSMKQRGLKVQLMADVLRLELLSLYGGVWADVMACPVQPIDNFANMAAGDAGFFTFKGAAPYTINWPGLCAKQKVFDVELYPFAGASINDNWFLIAQHPRNTAVEMWLAAVKEQIAGLPNNADPHGPNWDYEYHFPQCIVNNLYSNSSAFRKFYDLVPDLGYCQNNGNAVEYCAGTRHKADAVPDPKKWMYKGVQALQNMDFDAYEAHIRMKESQNSSGVSATALNVTGDGHGAQKRPWLCPNASDIACKQHLSSFEQELGIAPAPKSHALKIRGVARLLGTNERMRTPNDPEFEVINPYTLLNTVRRYPELRDRIKPVLANPKLLVLDRLAEVKRILAERILKLFFEGKIHY